MVVTDLAWKHHELSWYHAGILTRPDVIRHRASVSLSLLYCLSVSTRALHSTSQTGIKPLSLQKGSFFIPSPTLSGLK